MNQNNKKIELKEYLAKKNVKQILKGITESICTHMPENIPQHIVKYLAEAFQTQGVPAQQQFEEEKEKEIPRETQIPVQKEKESQIQPQKEIQKEKHTLNELPFFKKTNFKKNVPMKSPPAADESGDTVIDAEKSDAIRRRYSLSCTRRSGLSSETFDEKQQFKMKKVPKNPEQQKNIEEIIKNISFFKNLEAEDLQGVTDAMSMKEYQQGATIIHQGDFGDYFYIISEGECEFFIEKPEFSSKELVATRGKGEYFGELALMFGMPRAATVVAKTDVKTWRIDRSTFRSILMESTKKKREIYSNFLKKVPILQSLTPYERDILCDALESITAPANTTIVKEGEEGSFFCIVQKGKLKVTKKSKDNPNEEEELSTIEEAGYFGELALLFDEPRAATVTSVTDVELLKIDRDSFKKLLGPCEDILKRNLENYAKYDRMKNENKTGGLPSSSEGQDGEENKI